MPGRSRSWVLARSRPAAYCQALVRAEYQAAGRHPGAGGDQHRAVAAHLVDRGAADLADGLGDAVHAVDVRLAQLATVSVDGQPTTYLDRAVGNFRINIFRQRGTISLCVRYVRSHVPPFEDLKLPPVLLNLVMEKRGLVLIAVVNGEERLYSQKLACTECGTSQGCS